MKSTDKFLVAIVAGIVVLIVAAFVVVVTSPKPEYRTDDSPEATVHNYLLALQEQAYGRALGYLASSVPDRPADAGEMARDVSRTSWTFRENRDVSLVVASSRIDGDRAIVVVSETASYGPFPGDTVQTDIDMYLVREADVWKLTGGDAFWSCEWNE
jgi:hypothetical protein